MRGERTTISLGLLGALRLKRGDGTSIKSVLSQPKRVAILSYLACAVPGRFVRRDKLLGLFWPEADEKKARGALRQTLYVLRRSVGPEVICTRGDEEVGLDSSLMTCDVNMFVGAIERGALDEAMSLYEGDLLDGFHLPEAPAFERWLEGERISLRAQAAGVCEELCTRSRTAGDWSVATASARRWAEVDPWNVRAVLMLIEVLSERGNVAGALGVYSSFEKRFEEDLDLPLPAEFDGLLTRITADGAVPRADVSHRRMSTDPSVPTGTGLKPTPRNTVVVPDSPQPEQGATPVQAAAAPRRRSGWRWTVAGAVATLGTVVWLAMWFGRAPALELPSATPGSTRVLVTVSEDRGLLSLPSRRVRALHDELTVQLASSGLFAPLTRDGIVTVDPGEALDRFEADFVLSSTLLGERVSPEISVQLIDTRTQTVVWGERYRAPLEMKRGWEDEVSARVLAAIGGVARDRDVRLRAEVPPYTPEREAYFAYWDGRALWHQRQPSLMREALSLFQRAIQIDPDFAAPHAAIADIYNLMGSYDYGVLRPAEAFPVALSSARAAIERDPLLGEAWAALAFATGSYEWDFSAAQKAFQRALAESPEYAPAHHWYSLTLLVEGRFDEAGHHIEKAREVDPASPVIRTALGRHYYYTRDFDAAIEHYERALQMDPDFPPAHVGLGLTLALMGRLAEAEASYTAAAEIVGDDVPLLSAMRAHLSALNGDGVAARRVAAQLARMRGWVPPEYQAVVRLGLGEYDEAVALLETAYEERSAAVLFLEVDPLLDPLRGNPGFEALIERVRGHAG